jgi:hypothetical protein
VSQLKLQTFPVYHLGISQPTLNFAIPLFATSYKGGRRKLEEVVVVADGRRIESWIFRKESIRKYP